MNQDQAGHVVLELTTTPAEAQRRIRKATPTVLLRPVGGYVSYYWKDDLYVGGLKTRFEPTPYGCRLVGRFQLNPFMRIFVPFFYGWIAMLMYIAVSLVPPGDIVPSLVKALLLYGMGIGLGLFLWRVGRSEQGRTVQFLVDLFQDDLYGPEAADG